MTIDEPPELTFDNILAILKKNRVAEHRGDEFYAVAQLLAEGDLTTDQQKQLGKECVEMLERDHWWREHGGFNDE